MSQHSSPQHSVATGSIEPTVSVDIDFRRAQSGAEFQHLRKTHRSFVFPLALLFLLWYLVYVALAMYAPGLMANKIVGNVNLAVVLGLLQFLTTFIITGAYVSFANRKLDPQAKTLREEMERGDYAVATTERQS